MMFRRAIVRIPGENFADGLTTANLGRPDYSRVLEQHAAYCAALESCDLEVICLTADPHHPDSTFVEDTAVLTKQGAILARPGAASRSGEVAEIRDTVRSYFTSLQEIEAPGTLDAGDVCEAGSHFFIGLSHRTNEDGARQLGARLSEQGYTSSVVDIRGMSSILHLKSGIAYLDPRYLVVMEELAGREEFAGYNLMRVAEEESYACNCVQVNDRVLLPDGFPRLESQLRQLGYKPLLLDVSEFRKMDGGLSCLSLRF